MISQMVLITMTIAHDYLLNRLQNDDKRMVSMKFEMRQKTNRNTGMEPVDII